MELIANKKMAQELNFAKDASGTSSFSPDFSESCKSINLAAGDVKSFTVPSDVDKWIIAFGYVYNASIWISINNIAEPPDGGSWANTTSVLNPSSFKVSAGDVISAYNSGSTSSNIGVVLYAQP